MVKGKCLECGTGSVPQFVVNRGHVTRLPGMHPRCLMMAELTKVASQTPVKLIKVA